MAKTSCPPPRELQQLAAGNTPAPDLEPLLEHLQACDKCLAAVRTMTPSDTLVEMLGQAKSYPEGPDEAVVSRLIDKLSNLRPAAKTAQARPAFITFSCAACGKSLRSKAELAGKKVKCPGCGKPAAVPLAPCGEPEGSAVEDAKTLLPRAPASGRDTSPANPHIQSPPADRTQELDDKPEDQELWDFLAPPEQPDEIGRLGPYRVLKVLGAGGMGVVFKAEDPHLQRPVALKAMLPSLAASASAKMRFLREARAAAALKHDHVVTIYQVGEDRGAPFLAMEFLHGEPLDKRLERTRKLPLADTLRIGREIAEGLAAAHDNGLIHRDIKPGNIWLETRGMVSGEVGSGGEESGKNKKTSTDHSPLTTHHSPTRVKILDFGLARAMGDQSHLTQSGAIVGTPAYMAPEQASGGNIDHRGDLFSLGCVLYRMCTGKLPFKGKDTLSILSSLAMDTPQPPGELEPSLPPELCDLIVQLLAKKPDDRPPNAHVVVEALRALEGASSPAALPAALPRGRKRPGRRRLVALGAAAALLLAVLLAGIVFFIPAGNGTIRVEVNDPDIKVAIDKGELKLVDKGGTAYTVAAGRHGLLIKHGAAEEFEAEKFTLRKGETIAFRIELVAGKLQVVRDGKVVATREVPAGGKAASISAAGFDSLKREDIDPYELKMAGGGDPQKAPDELVAIFGDSRLAHHGLVRAVVLSKDGKTMITAEAREWAPDGLVLVWDTATRRVREVIQPPAAPGFLALNAAETVLAVGVGGGTMLYEYGSWKQLKILSGHKEGMNWVALSSDGKRAAAFDEGNNLFVWNVETGKELHKVPGVGRGRGRAVFSPDGKVLAATGVSKDFSIRLWEMASWKELKPLQGHKAVAELAFAKDGQALYSASSDSTLRRWDWAKGEGRLVIAAGPSFASLALSPDGKTIATVDGGPYGNNVNLWNADTGQKLETFANPGGRDDFHRGRVAFSGDGKLLAAGQFTYNAVGLWDLSGKTPKKDQGYRELPQGRLAVAPDGKTFITGSTKGMIRVWDVAGRKVLRTFEGGFFPALSPDGKHLATTTPPGPVRLWNPDTGKLTAVLDPAVYATWLRFSPDGRYLAAAGTSLWWWDLKTRKVRTTGRQGCTGIPFTPDGNLLAEDAFRGDKVRLLKTSSGEVARELKATTPGGVETPAITGDGKVLAVRADLGGSPELIDLDSGKTFLNLPPCEFLAAAPHGRRLAGTNGNTLWVWDGSAGRKEITFGPGRLGPPAFSPDGRYVLINNLNGTVFVVRLDLPATKAD